MTTEHFKQRLEEELAQVESGLREAGSLVNEAAGDWEGKAPEMDTMSPIAEPNEAADKIEEFEANRGITNNLEARFKEVKHALSKFDTGSYGICEISGETIEEERLEANAAARTCRAHMDQEHELPPVS